MNTANDGDTTVPTSDCQGPLWTKNPVLYANDITNPHCGVDDFIFSSQGVDVYITYYAADKSGPPAMLFVWGSAGYNYIEHLSSGDFDIFQPPIPLHQTSSWESQPPKVRELALAHYNLLS